MSVVKKYRGTFSKSALAYTKERITNRDDVDRSEFILTYTAMSEELLAEIRQYIRENGGFERIYESVAGCTISCHCGPGTLGLLLVRK